MSNNFALLPMIEIIDLYFNHKMSAAQIARKYNVSDNTIRSRIRKENYLLRTLSEAQSIWQKGKPKSEIMKQRLSEAKKGKPSPKPINFGKKVSIALKGRKFSLSHKKSLSLNNGMRGKYGEQHPGWKGGNSTFARALVQTVRYKQWRTLVYERDDYICQHCGQIGGRLNVHHKKKLLLILKEFFIDNLDKADQCCQLWDINNGITLCKACHKKEEHRGGKIEKKHKVT